MNRDDDNRRAYPTVEEERPVANEFVPKIKNSVKSQTEYNIAFVGPKRHLDSTTSSTVGAGATGEEMANNESRRTSETPLWHSNSNWGRSQGSWTP